MLQLERICERNKNNNIRVQIIAFHFTNCEVNSSYCNCNAVNHTRKAKQFLSKGKFNSSTLYFSTLHPHYILILFLNCMLLPKEILLITKIALQCAKGALQFLKIFYLQQAKSLVTLGMFIAKWISNSISNSNKNNDDWRIQWNS